ncbi:hypothetical protein EON65_34615 [archaeon]|nr:MAG: hypothetical protein EON65_34615 [archaeon]
MGVVVDDPTYGKNDGTVRGVRYFSVPGGEKRGLMVSVEEVKKI